MLHPHKLIPMPNMPTECPQLPGTANAMTTNMTNTIRYTTDLVTGLEVGDFTLVADVDYVRGVEEVDLIEVYNNHTNELFEMQDWDDMIDAYEGDWESDGVLCWRELQDLVAVKGA